jgi:hypothetical protein
LHLAKRVQAPAVLVQFLDASTDADAFAQGVEIGIADWEVEHGDKLLWAIESRRAAVDCALHKRWLDPDGESAKSLYRFYPDLGRRYSSSPGTIKTSSSNVAGGPDPNGLSRPDFGCARSLNLTGFLLRSGPPAAFERRLPNALPFQREHSIHLRPDESAAAGP